MKGKRRKRRIVVTTIMLLLLAIAAVWLLSGSESRRATTYVQKARESMTRGDYEGALLYLRRADETEDEVLMLIADCYEAMGNYERALETLRRLNTGNPAVADRIQSVEQQRQTRTETVQIAGIEFDSRCDSVTLDGLSLTDDSLSELGRLYALDYLSLENNNLTDIRVLGELRGLDDVNLAGNRIRDINPLAEIGGLRRLTLDRNPVEDCSALKGLKNLISLSVVDTAIEADDLRGLSVALPVCAIRFGQSGEEKLLLAGDEYSLTATELNLSGKSLTDLSLVKLFPNLSILDLSENEIADLHPLMGLPELQKLNISSNMVTDLRPLIGLPALIHLEAADNLIQESGSAGSIAGLEELDLSGNSLRDFSGLCRLSELRTLKLCRTELTDAAMQELTGLVGLTALDLRDNPGLSDRAVGALASVLAGCNILTSDLVYEIDLSGHTVLSNEKKILLPAGGVSDLSGLARMTALEELDLRDNDIESLYPLEISPSRETIRRLILSDNNIADITPLSTLTGLVELDLSNNRIESVYHLGALGTLQRLVLTGNPLREDAIRELQEQIPNCVIVF